MNPEYEYTYNSEKEQKFWMIVGDGNTPKVRHHDIQRARDEIERLALKNPGVKFYLLAATECVVHGGLTRTKL